MKRIFTLIIFTFLSSLLSAQDFTGQWKGGFVDNSSSFVGFGGERIDYVLELETNGNNVTGYSYTYFVEDGKRYYTICKLRGTINRKAKEVVITEYERTKFNTPREIRNCFQVHRLTYFKSKSYSDIETLEGSWTPAPNQEGDCGYGKTILSRRLLKKLTPLTNRSTPKTQPGRDNPYRDVNQNKSSTTVKTNTTPPKTPTVPLVKNKTEQKKTTPVAKTDKPAIKNDNSVAKNDLPERKDQQKINDVVKQPDPVKQPEPNEQKITTPSIKFEKRTNKVLKTIQVEKEKITVELYDNGEIDGDTVSVFYNGKLLLSKKRLSDKPLSLTLDLDDDSESNELTMYAENLGEIPPNTALMVVKDGDKRYEVRITSDTEKNGTIAFVRKPK